MNPKFRIAVLTITLLLSVGLLLRSHSDAKSEPGIRQIKAASLAIDKINSEVFPWSVFPGKITEVKSYRESYDLNSNDWVAEFSLKPEEARQLEGLLFPVPATGLTYHCDLKVADWLEEKDICDAGKMQAKRFKGYVYNSSHCENGCDQTVILWVNEATGQSYIVGALRNAG